jgi:hypothetical protein
VPPAGVPQTPGNEQNPAAGAPITPVTPGNTNTGANAGTPNDGAGGASMVPMDNGNPGAAGSSMGTGGATGNDPGDPTQPDPTPTDPPPAAGPDIPCPAGAIFCSGFEGTGLPAGTAFQPAYLASNGLNGLVSLDTTQKHSGAQSFLVLPTSDNFSYRVLAVPVSAQQFWVRMFFRTDVAFGSSNDHESIFAVSEGDVTKDNNNEGRRVELSEQFGYMLLNISDATPEPLVRRQLSANEWHCVEARYDGAAGQVEIFADGEQFINEQSGTVQLNIRSFRLGYMEFHGGARSVWYDDVVIAPNRVGCN